MRLISFLPDGLQELYSLEEPGSTVGFTVWLPAGRFRRAEGRRGARTPACSVHTRVNALRSPAARLTTAPWVGHALACRPAAKRHAARFAWTGGQAKAKLKHTPPLATTFS